MKILLNYKNLYKFLKYYFRMAYLLIMKLLEPNTSKRYTADKVLKHPWITRNPIDEIPKTYLETMRIRTLKNKIKNVINYINRFISNKIT